MRAVTNITNTPTPMKTKCRLKKKKLSPYSRKAITDDADINAPAPITSNNATGTRTSTALLCAEETAAPARACLLGTEPVIAFVVVLDAIVRSLVLEQ